MKRRLSKGKGKRNPSPSSSSDEDSAPQNQNRPPKRTRIASPERVQAKAIAKAGSVASSSSSLKGLAGFASLVNRTNLSAAQTETNNGLKSGSNSGRLSRASTSKSKMDVAEGITVGSIVFIVVGIRDNTIKNPDNTSFQPVYRLRCDVETSATALTGMRQAGLCVMRSTGYEFLSTDTYSVIDNKLHTLFPKLFEYLAELEADDLQDTKASWVICMKEPYKKTQLTVYSDDNDLPTGFDIMKAVTMTRSKAGLQDRILYLATRNPVPLDVVQSWRPKASLCKTGASSSLSASDSESSRESDGEVDTSSDPPVLPSILPQSGQLRRSTRLRQVAAEEAEVVNEVIDISDDDIAQHNVPAAPGTPPYVSAVNDNFSSSMYLGGEDNPWNQRGTDQ